MKSKLLFTVAYALLAASAIAQAAELQYKPSSITNKELETPFPASIVGNMYYVGTCDLGCYLIDTGAGLILINSGADGSYPLIKANIEKLGFKTSDIKIITSTHGHGDHVGDLAALPERCARRQDPYERTRCAISNPGQYRLPARKGAGFIPTIPSRSISGPSRATISSSATPISPSTRPTVIRRAPRASPSPLRKQGGTTTSSS